MGVLVCTTLALLLPALWNGYPLFFYDSGDYIDSAFSFTPKVWRTLPYGLFLAVAQVRLSPWLPVIVQSLVLAYLLWELALAFAPQRPVAAMVPIVAVLTLGTGLPWFTSQVMPDALTGAMVLGLALLAFAAPAWPRLALIALLTVIAICAHASHLGTAIALTLTLAAMALFGHHERPRVLLPAVVALAGVLATPLAHKLSTGELYLSRSAPIMALGRLIQDGEAQIYLRRDCPQTAYALCPYVDELRAGERGANDFLWGQDSPFYKIKGWEHWQRFAPEAREIVIGTLRTRPLENLRAAFYSWVRQLVTFGTGSGLVPGLWEATNVELEYFPAQGLSYLAARQYNGFDLTEVSRLHVVVLTLFMLGGLALALAGLRRGGRMDRLLLLLVVAALVNAAITGVLSAPDDRYQARLVWLFVPVVLLALGTPHPRRPP